MKFRSTVRTAVLDRSDVFVLWLFAVLAALVGVAALVTAVTAIGGLFGDAVPVTLSTVMPVPADAATGTATIVSGSFDRADVVVSGIDMGARFALAGSIAVSALTTAIVAASIAALCRAVLRGRPFVRSMTWLLATASITLIAGTLIAAGLDTAAMFSIVAALNPDPMDAVFPFMSEYDFGPLLIGLVLSVVATAFQLGQKMQRDTEGLV
ncbi:hypothetical protein [Labedella endophytica]|uniref:DUF2975 domain-containing protein n=1 Tax=Labedella endophytica TaxID=1523160 RepID=A0A3S0Y2X4_9MICO|nr:hypothetical protein [Labedella endophytica]RUR03525.1 hypothetical protein ELQ94_03060 [Labedella endophytica]